MPKKQKGGTSYFQTTKKGELRELQDDLNSNDKNAIKEAVKKVIAAMTVGKDVSMLFSDIIKSMGTDNIELKKLVYLYIINYARSQPEKVILVVNMFQRDANKHPNPLVRALAIRTMGCIRVDTITEYLCDPLVVALKDQDPYVRKTAAICVAKLYDINHELVEERGMIDRLRDMISDVNPMVVANAVAALAEICEASGKDYFKMHTNMLSKLLTALNECTEWGKVFILDALAKFEGDKNQAKDIIERVSPQLQNNNSAVVLSSIKIIIKNMSILGDDNKKLISKYYKKMAPALVTLVNSTQPEIQYVALRNISLIVQRHPSLLKNNIRVFFVKFNDASYIKKEKLEILIKLSTKHTISEVLLELKEYAQEIDISFVRKSVRAIGQIAIKLENGAEKCVQVLSELIKTGVNYVVQEAVVVIKDIFRRYPNRYEKIILLLCDNLESLDEPEAKASMIWILGEYADRIKDITERIEYFVDSFEEESTLVKLQILTATVKLFLKKPNESKKLITRVLNLATEKSDNPDLRDRGYVYWRLLSSDIVAAKTVVLAKRPKISSKNFDMPKDYLDKLLTDLSLLSSVYHRLPSEFVAGRRKDVKFEQFEEERENDEESSVEDSEDEYEEDEEEEKTQSQPQQNYPPRKVQSNNNNNNNMLYNQGQQQQQQQQQKKQQEFNILDDLFGGGNNNNNNNQQQQQQGTTGGLDLLGEFDPFGTDNNNNQQQQKLDEMPSNTKNVINSNNSNGLLNIDLGFTTGGTMHIKLNNISNNNITRVDFKFNKNYLGINLQSPTVQLNNNILNPGSTQISKLYLQPYKLQVTPKKPYDSNVQMAVRVVHNGIQQGQKPPVLTYYANIPAYIFFGSSNTDQNTVLNNWKSLQGNDNSCMIKRLNNQDSKYIQNLLTSNMGLGFVYERVIQNKGCSLYFAGLLNGKTTLAEVSVANNGACRIVTRCNDKYVGFVMANEINRLCTTGP